MPALKRFLCSLLTLCSLPLLAGDSTIGNLTPITTVPDAYRMPWENPGVLDYYITFQNLTNQILSGYQTTNTILGQISVGNGGALTNVPFSIWTNYGAAPLTYTNLNGLAFSPGFGMTSSWTFTNIPGIGPIGIRVNSADTNHFITTDYGGTFTGAVYSVATSQLAPASNQLVTAAFVRNLAAGSGVPYYAGNTVDPVATNATPIGQPVYQFQSTIPPSFNRTYTTADYLTNNGYIGSVVTTNSFQSLQGQILVVAYLAYSGGSASPTLTVHPEIYISYDRTNWTTEFSAGTQNIFYGTTNAYQFLIDIPLTVATNSAGFWIERRFKVDSVTGAGTRTLTFLGGTNTVSGVNDASHITAQSPTATSGNAYLAANQTFTGTNTFTKHIYLSNSGTNTITLDPATGTVTASNFAGNAGGTTNQHSSSFGQPYNPSTTIAVFEGDSLTDNSKSYAYWLTNVLGWSFAWATNTAVSGSSVLDMTQRWSTVVAPYSPGAGTNGLLFVWIGANDHLHNDALGSSTAVISIYSNYLARAIASNFIPVVFTILPRDSVTYPGDLEARTNRFLINEAIRGWSQWAYIVPVDGYFPNPFNGTDYSDGTHITTNAYYRLAVKLDGILRGPKHNFAIKPTEFGTNHYWYSPEGVELLGLNKDTYTARVSGAVAATNFVTLNADGTATTNGNAQATVATLPSPAVAGQMVWANDVITPAGVGARLVYDGSNWRTKEDIVATADLFTFILNAKAAGVHAFTPVCKIFQAHDVYQPSYANMSSSTGGSGAGTAGGTATAIGFPIQVATGTDTGGYCSMYSGSLLQWGAAQTNAVGATVSVTSLCDSTDSYWAYFGTDTGTGSNWLTTAACFVYDCNQTYITSAISNTWGFSALWTNNWIAVSCKSSTYYYHDTLLPISTTTPARLLITLNQSELRWYTNGVLCCANTTVGSIPASTSRWKVFIGKFAGTNNRYANTWDQFIFERYATRTW